MSYGTVGLNAAIDGVAAVGLYLAPCTADPGATGVGIDVAVTPLAASWEAAGATTPGEASSVEVTWEIPSGQGAKTYTHFAVVTTADDATYQYVTGGDLSQSEAFSNNGGQLKFTGTLVAEDAPA